ncbi:MAG: GFA family protein [Paracoccaceae bacterium]|nr:GFA family protein [Paracoccaceae bacterium]MDG1739215.1 GFA family protein [Paracoccaceae bacterium]MDG2260143.1 GFA family protein [Paracoccaceae bacterium]
MNVKGKCECGAVRFEAEDVRETVHFCHCSQCRRTSGHQWAATRADNDKFRFISDETLKWYASSEIAKRGFCGTCGSSLFYQVNGADHIGIAAGCIDEPTGLVGGKHIFTASKGDYYDIADGLPQVKD